MVTNHFESLEWGEGNPLATSGDNRLMICRCGPRCGWDCPTSMTALVGLLQGAIQCQSNGFGRESRRSFCQVSWMNKSDLMRNMGFSMIFQVFPLLLKGHFSKPVLQIISGDHRVRRYGQISCHMCLKVQ